MGLLINGQWSTKWYEPDEQGRFVRSTTRFRGQVRDEAGARHPARAGRYHLYVSLACPWAHRTLLARRLLGLEEAISLSIVDPLMGDDGWRFSREPGCIPDPLFGAQFLREIYVRSTPEYTGRVTVPVLWDKEEGVIVNNESRQIIQMFATALRGLGDGALDLYPEALRAEIDALMDAIYEPINNGVYRAGFATTQGAYEEAVQELFAALARWDLHLSRRRYLCGDVLTLADLCLFTTLLRFEPVYHDHFKCNLRRLRDLSSLWNYTLELYQWPGVSQTCDLDHIKRHYFGSHPMINPTGVVPLGPTLDLSAPWTRPPTASGAP